MILLPIPCYNTWPYFQFRAMMLDRFCAVMLNPTSDSTPWCLTLLPISCRDAWPISCHNAWSYFRFRAVMLDPTSISCRDATSDYLMIFPIPLDLTSDFVLWWYFRLLDPFRFRAVMLLPITWWYFQFRLILLPISCRDATSNLLDPTSDFVPWYTSDCLMLFPILFRNATSDSYFWYWCYFCFCILTWS